MCTNSTEAHNLTWMIAGPTDKVRVHERQVLLLGREVAAQVEIVVKVESNLSCVSFERLVPGAFIVGLIGSTCTTLQ
jgi:hypothetical protein